MSVAQARGLCSADRLKTKWESTFWSGGSSRTWCAVPGVSDEEYSWPMWVARDTIIFLRKVQGDDDQVARLMIGDVQKGTARELCEGVNIWDVPSVNAERTEAAVMAFVGGAEEDASTGDAYNWQVVSVNLKTGEKRILTDEPLGAGLSAYNPKANKIAYMTPPDFECDFATYRILDLDSGVTMMIHRGAEEQLLATALQLEEDGDFERAVAAYDRLVKQYPDSRFAEAAGLYAFVLRLRYPELGLEPVLSALPHMNLDELRPRGTRPCHNACWMRSHRILPGTNRPLKHKRGWVKPLAAPFGAGGGRGDSVLGAGAFAGQLDKAHLLPHEAIDPHGRQGDEVEEVQHDGRGLCLVGARLWTEDQDGQDDGDVKLPDQSRGAGHAHEYRQQGLHHEGAVPGGLDVECEEQEQGRHEEHGPRNEAESHGLGHVRGRAEDVETRGEMLEDLTDAAGQAR